MLAPTNLSIRKHYHVIPRHIWRFTVVLASRVWHLAGWLFASKKYLSATTLDQMDNFTRQTSTPNTPEYASPGVSPRLIDLYSPPPPSKKRRLLGKAPSDLSDQVDVHSPNSPLLVTSETFDSDGNGLSAGLESALVDIKPEYDLTRTEDENGLSALDQCGIPSDSRKWIRGESSIYVDAFNLALDTVLEDESHLFDERERRVFDEWKRLDYESQYLCALLLKFQPV